MNTFPTENAAAQSSSIFRVHLSEQQVVEEPLDLHKPIYLVVSVLTHQYQLPTIEGGYSIFIFGGPERRPLSRELSLGRSAYTEGGDLYLASARSPWWVPVPAVPAPTTPSARPTTRSLPRPQRSLAPKTVALGVMGLTAIALLSVLFWPQPSTPTDNDAPAIAILAPSPITAAPTATLLPALPTALASPLLDSATRASLNYQQGLKAYESQEWARAADLFQQVYSYDASYLDIRHVLAATFYNWGVSARDEGAVADAQQHFQAALVIEVEHPLAPVEQQKASFYLDAQAATQRGDPNAAIERYRELLKLNNADYGGARANLYALLVAQAAVLAQAGDGASLGSAYTLYLEAAGLDIPDRSAAQQQVAAIAPRLSTPTPKPASQKLRFSVANYNEEPGCISVGINGIISSEWYFSVDGISGMIGHFDAGGHARVCGLAAGQEVTFTVLDHRGKRVAGGSGVPSRGGAIMSANWR